MQVKKRITAWYVEHDGVHYKIEEDANEVITVHCYLVTGWTHVTSSTILSPLLDEFYKVRERYHFNRAGASNERL